MRLFFNSVWKTKAKLIPKNWNQNKDSTMNQSKKQANTRKLSSTGIHTSQYWFFISFLIGWLFYIKTSTKTKLTLNWKPVSRKTKTNHASLGYLFPALDAMDVYLLWALTCSSWTKLLYCIVLYCIVLYCIVLHCIALHCTALHCTALHYIALHCIALHCTALHCIALYWFVTISSSHFFGFGFTTLNCKLLELS